MTVRYQSTVILLLQVKWVGTKGFEDCTKLLVGMKVNFLQSINRCLLLRWSTNQIKSKQGFPYQCGSYSDCISNEFSNIYSACDCTYAATSGKKHCLGFHGDNKLKSHFERIKNTMQKSFTGCKYWEVIWGRGNCGLW